MYGERAMAEIVYAIRRTEAGTPLPAGAQPSMPGKKYAHLGVRELRRLHQLEEENGRLKWLVADLSLNKNI